MKLKLTVFPAAIVVAMGLLLITGAAQAEPVTIGGSVILLEGSGLVLQNNGGDDETITGNGDFTFDTPLEPGSTYSVTVAMNPTFPEQECFVARCCGTVPNQAVTNVVVVCAPPERLDTALLTGINFLINSKASRRAKAAPFNAINFLFNPDAVARFWPFKSKTNTGFLPGAVHLPLLLD